MKTVIFHLACLLLLSGLAAPVSAQPRNMGRFLMFQAKSHPSYARIIMENEALRRTGPLPPFAQQERQLLRDANFAAQCKRVLWKIQTRAGITPRKAVLNLEKLGAYTHPYAKYPSLGKEYAWEAKHFANLLPHPSSVVPPLPWYERDGYVYWAGNLDSQGIALRRLLQSGQTEKLTPLMHTPLAALHRALPYKKPGQTVSVLIALKRPAPDAPLQIKAALVWLQRGADSRWHRVELKENSFVLSPYFFRQIEK